jgi:ABC-type multidrug transport system ATPase subunit
VSFAVAPGSIYALVGKAGSGKAAIVRSALGQIRPEGGQVLVLGLDPRRNRRRLKEFVRYDPAAGELRIEAAAAGSTLLIVAENPGQASLADRVGFLKDGRLLLDEEVPILLSRFRRLRYTSELTETRTEYGTELDAFDAVRVKVRGWGVDAVVSNFDDAAFDRFRETEGVKDAQALPMTLTEIFEAVVGGI